MTTLLLHVCQYRSRKAQGYRQQQLVLQRGAVGTKQRLCLSHQPELTAFAHYFASSRVARSRYTPALAADLPSPAVMLAADTQAAPCCLRQQRRPHHRPHHPQQQQQQQQKQQKLGSVNRSYSDPNLQGRCSKAGGATPAPAVAVTVDDSAASAVAAVGTAIATFSISSAPDEPASEPVSFRHSCDCLLDIDDRDGSAQAAGSSLQLPLPPTLATQLTLRKVASCSATAKERGKRRVQFADEVGKKLLHVRVFSEPSCAPPSLSVKPRRDFAADDADEEASGQQSAGGKSGKFKCQFAQPASKYILFRENVEKNCLSLRNLYFDDDLTVKGSVTVKNVSFDKRVFIRVTFDEWATSQDMEATYASSQDSRQDTFVFSFQCPTSCERGFQLCVCYEAAGQAFWDSNGGANYQVTVRKPKTKKAADAYTSDYKPNYNGVADFAEFSAWDHFSDRVYY